LENIWSFSFLTELLFGKVFFSWMAFYFLHSFLLTLSVRSFLSSRFGLSQQGYRLFFNLFSLVSLLLVFIIQLRHEAAQIFSLPLALKMIAAGFLLFSIFMLKQSFKNYRMAVFIGLEKETQMPFSASGLNAYMRHPLYSFSLLAFLSVVFILPSTNSFQMFLASVLYVQIGYRLEERKLIEIFGVEYQNYQKRVAALIPRLFQKD